MSTRYFLDVAQEIVRSIRQCARSHGFIVGLYGSVLHEGAGNDVDLVFVPWRIGANISALVSALEIQGWKIADREESVLNRVAIHFTVMDTLVDAVFYRVGLNEVLTQRDQGERE